MVYIVHYMGIGYLLYIKYNIIMCCGHIPNTNASKRKTIHEKTLTDTVPDNDFIVQRVYLHVHLFVCACEGEIESNMYYIIHIYVYYFFQPDIAS